MPDFRPVLLVSGALVAALGVLMIIPLALDLFAADPADRANWPAFATGSIMSIFAGGGLAAVSAGRFSQLGVREGFLVVTFSWMMLVAFAAIPLSVGAFRLSYTDAFFEAMSGLTTTGSTVITGLDDAPPGVLLWRSMLQWLGGVGIIIMAFAVMPALKIGGMQLFKVEAWDTSEKFIANAARYSIYLSAIYAFFTSYVSSCMGVRKDRLRRAQSRPDNRFDWRLFNERRVARLFHCGERGAGRSCRDGVHDHRQPSFRTVPARVCARECRPASR